jgi:transketolase
LAAAKVEEVCPLSVESIETKTLAQRAVTTIRALAIDGVEAAQSGHPGMPMGAAPMAYVIFSRFLRFDPDDPRWPARDRFVLSAGHGSMLLYALLHLTGYDLPLDELRRFRQWGSKTPGHPEYGLTPGVETTTGPLGQGFGTGVGMAMASRWLSARYDPEGKGLLAWRVFGIVSDGDLMEGLSQEAASLAGHLRLGNLIYLYDDNHISIEGPTTLAFSDDVEARFRALGWHTAGVEDGNDLDAIAAAVEAALADPRPSLIRVRTHIGYGSPHGQDTAKVHGAPLGAEEARLTKAAYGWPDTPFYVPDDVRAHMRACGDRGRAAHAEWRRAWEAYEARYPDRAAALRPILTGPTAVRVPSADLPSWHDGALATRQASGQVLQALARVPALLGGSADLAPSTETRVAAWDDFTPDHPGQNLHFGVREHAMGAALNGLALSGLRPYGGTFLVFSDYMRPAIRLAALMALPTIYVFTHDSIGLGEDGPTHQPVEHLAALRAMPRLWVIRPADANETRVAWQMALERTDGPTALILTRQKVPVLDPARYPVEEARRGAYVLAEASDGSPRVILLATGSEVGLALEARARLEAEGLPTRVVSMPCWEVFRAQPAAYRDAVLPPAVTARVAVEAASPFGWAEWVGPAGAIVALDHFGASAPYQILMEQFGFTAEHVAAVAAQVAQGGKSRA